MSETQTTIHDSDNYHKLSKPFDGPAAAEAAVSAFWDEFYALRNKHKIADAYVIVSIPIRYEDGKRVTLWRQCTLATNCGLSQWLPGQWAASVRNVKSG